MREKAAQLFLANKLKKNRTKIDLIDQKLLALLNQRLRIAMETGKIKKKIGKKIYDRKREKEVLEKLRLRLRLRPRNRPTLRERDLKKIFATIIKVCRKSER